MVPTLVQHAAALKATPRRGAAALNENCYELEPVGRRVASQGSGGIMKPNIGVNDGQRDAVVEILNTLLADEYLLYTKTRNYHWNVVGPQFNDLHKFFQAQYEQLDEIVDEVAERARSLGGQAFGTLAEFSKMARLRESPGKSHNMTEMIASLLADHEAVIRS